MGKLNIWTKQQQLNNNFVHKTIKQTLLDQCLQKWDDDTQKSSKGRNYRLFKATVSFENYFKILPKQNYLRLIKFRLANHKLPIETGRWENIELSERKWQKCSKNLLGDEFHYLFECTYFNFERRRYISKFYFVRPNVIKFNKLMNSDNKTVLAKLSIFVSIFMKSFNSYFFLFWRLFSVFNSHVT